VSGVERIASRHNPRLREVARLLGSARDRRKAGRCVLEGEHLIAAHGERFGPPELLVVADDCAGRPGIGALLARHGDRSLLVPDSLFAGLADLPPGVGVLAVVATPQLAAQAAGEFCLLLEGVQDPGNVGTMLRSAAAAGAAQVYLSADSASAWSPKVLRAAQGAHFRLAIAEDVDLVAWARGYVASGGRVLALAVRGGRSVFATDMTGPVALVVGSEGAGLSEAMQQAATDRVTIPMPGGVESLNAAAAAAICLFERVRQRSAG
jgi:RNA methyltransferase, TrmH family